MLFWGNTELEVEGEVDLVCNGRAMRWLDDRRAVRHSRCSTLAFHFTLIVQIHFQVLPESLFQPSVL